jgi:hypothetical protein
MADEDHRWEPEDADYRKIWEHLQRQRNIGREFVKLDDGRIVRVGADAEGEGE